MTTPVKTPAKRPTKAAAPKTAPEAAAPVAEAPIAAAPAAAAVPTASTFFAGFEFPKVDFPTFEMPKFEVPKFDASAFGEVEVPAALREFAEKAVAQARAGYDKIKAATEEATDALEDAYEATRTGVVEMNVKALDAAKDNSNAALDHAKDLLGVKTFAEAIELQTSFVRQQYEALSAQAKEIQELATKIAGEAGKPAKDILGKTVDLLKKD